MYLRYLVKIIQSRIHLNNSVMILSYPLYEWSGMLTLPPIDHLKYD